MTAGDLIRHIGLEFGLDQTASSDEQLLMFDWASDAVMDLLEETGAYITSSTLNLSANDGDYTLSASLLRILAVEYNAADSTQVELQPRTLQEILDMREFAQSASDTPRYYAHEADQLWLYPVPTDADTITLWGIPKPTAMSSTAHDPSTATYGGIPTQYHPALLAYMRWRAASYDERKGDFSPAQLRDAYDREVVRVKKRLRRLGGRPAPMRVGYPGGTGFPRRNDVYPER